MSLYYEYNSYEEDYYENPSLTFDQFIKYCNDEMFEFQNFLEIIEVHDADDAYLDKLYNGFDGPIQLNLSLSKEYNNKPYSIEEMNYDEIYYDVFKFIPSYVFLSYKIIIKNELKSINKNIYFLQVNNYIFIIEQKINKCEIVNYDNCEEIDPNNGSIINNPPERHSEKWNTYYILRIFKNDFEYHEFIDHLDLLPPIINIKDHKEYLKNMYKYT